MHLLRVSSWFHWRIVLDAWITQTWLKCTKKTTDCYAERICLDYALDVCKTTPIWKEKNKTAERNCRLKEKNTNVTRDGKFKIDTVLHRDKLRRFSACVVAHVTTWYGCLITVSRVSNCVQQKMLFAWSSECSCLWWESLMCCVQCMSKIIRT